MPATHTDPSERAIVITREFSAPRKLVWDVWTRPEHVANWWGPRGFTTTVTEMDLRPGGKWRYVMHGPDGTDYPVHGVFREVAPIERIVTTDEFDENWQPPQPIDLPRGIVTTAQFDELGAKTRLTMTITHATIEDKKKHEAMGVVGGWNSSFDCMDDYLAALTDEGHIRRLIAEQFDAIRAKNVARLMKPYAPDAVTFDAKLPYRMAAADELRKTWEVCFPYFPDTFQVETRDLHVSVDGALGFAHWLFRIVTPDPNHPAAQTWMRLTGCYRKVRGEWRIAHEHCSVPFDPMTGRAAFALDV